MNEQRYYAITVAGLKQALEHFADTDILESEEAVSFTIWSGQTGHCYRGTIDLWHGRLLLPDNDPAHPYQTSDTMLQGLCPDQL